MSHGDSEKGLRYIGQLYEARCNGQWQEVPELARKVEKHASTRKCLTLAARAGAAINQGKNGFNVAESQFGAALSSALEREEMHRDILDGLVTRAAMFYGLDQADLALGQIPETLHRSPAPNAAKAENAWFAVCVIQGTLIRGLALEAQGNSLQAGNTYRSIIAYVSRVVALHSRYVELSRWTEELLSHICLFFSMETDTKSAQLGEAMAAFHLLSRFLDDQKWRPLGTRGSFTGSTPRSVWRAFYEALSRIVEEDLVYHPSPIHRDHDTPEHRGLLEDEDFLASRLQQRADLRRVEANYESLLLQETEFPRANESNEEVKSWVELVMSNWRTLCGPNWTDAELGAGGKVALGRSTMDILYRAATKTFHSTQILRHLFTTHTFLGEFDLAFHAFDSYVDIITKGKARVDKSGDAGIDLDDDETALRFAVDAVKVSCRYGSEKATSKALIIGETLQKWLGKVASDSMVNSDGDEKDSYDTNGGAVSSNLSPETVSLAYYAIGLSQANYARITYNPMQRAELQTKAINNLGKSLDQGLHDSISTECLFALGLALADKRDIPGAIQAVKRALVRPQENSFPYNSAIHAVENEEPAEPSKNGPFARERKLLPAWHLLALLLCARDEFDIAAATCNAAFEQFGDSVTFFGLADEAGISKHSVQQLPAASRGLVDKMDSFEKQTVLEIKMTQVALLETTDGPEAAVNASNELLALYARLFGKIDLASFKGPKTPYKASPPKTLSGTKKNKLAKPMTVRSKVPPEQYAPLPLPSTSAALSPRPTSSTLRIQGMNEKGTAFITGDRYSESTLGRSGSLRRFGSIRGHRGKVQSDAGASHLNEKLSSDAGDVDNTSPIQRRDLPPRSDSLAANAVLAQDHQAGHPQHSISNSQDQIRPQPSKHTLRLPAPPYISAGPPPRFTLLQERRHKVSLLIKVWLFVATLYVRASQLEDAKQSIEEARKLITALELEVSAKSSRVRTFEDRGWASGQSVEELWADIYATRGLLYQSQSRPHDALSEYEEALSHCPDHPRATVELSGILLDIYCQKTTPEKPDPARDSLLPDTNIPKSPVQLSPTQQLNDQQHHALGHASRRLQPSPPELYRLAARDRAYGLLISLTKLGAGWDDSEAWFALARAFEESGQLDKAKEALWWTIELEDTKPVRHWDVVSPGGFVL